MVALASEDIAPTCLCKDPTSGIVATAGVAYTALVDQHMMPLEGMEDRMSDLLPWDGLLPMRHLGATNGCCASSFPRVSSLYCILFISCLGGELGHFSLGRFFEMAA
jgi:hypothetical protein